MTTGGATVSPVTPDPVTPEATTRPSGGGQGGDGEFPFNTEVRQLYILREIKNNFLIFGVENVLNLGTVTLTQNTC